MDSVFEDGKGFGDGGAAEVVGGGFLVLVEVFPIEAFVEVGEFAFEGGGEEVIVSGGEEEAVGVAFEKEIGVMISCAIDESDGVGVRG